MIITEFIYVLSAVTVFFLWRKYYNFDYCLKIDIRLIITMTSPAPPQKSGWTKFVDAVQPFWIGGLSGMLATCVIQPIDMIKVMIQLKSQAAAKLGPNAPQAGFMSAVSDIYKTGGIRGFYRGLDSALARQIFYTTTRLGIYRTLTQYLIAQNKKQGRKTMTGFQKVYSAIVAGFIGSLVGNPPDLALVRMQADIQLPEAERRNYKNVFDAFSRISKEEGVLGLWRGATPTVIRAVALNLAMLASYDQVKERLLQTSYYTSETLQVRVLASMVSGFLSSFVSLPFDNAKTKLQKMKKGPDGKFPYKNIFDAMAQTVSKEGFTRLWVGYPTFYIRIAPHVCITLVFQDFLTDHVKRFRSKN